MKFKTLLLRTLALPAVVLTLTCFNSALAQRLNLNFNSAKGYLFRITSKLDEPKLSTVAVTLLLLKWYFPNLESCGYIIQYSNPKRAKRIEAEHIVPASYFGKTRECWLKKPGRQNCENTDKYFNLIESDLHNLYPSVGEVNNERLNFAFSDSIKKTSPFGQCQMLIDRKDRELLLLNALVV